MRLPNEAEQSYLMFRPFVPFTPDSVSSQQERRNLQGFMIAHSDPDRYGQLEVFEVPADVVVDGPAQFNSNIQTEIEISREITLLNGNGSQVRQGNLLLIPIGNSLIYVRPLYVEATGGTAVPEIQQVIVGVGDRIVMRPTLEAALAEIVPGFDPLGLGDEPEVPGSVSDADDGEPPSVTVPPTERAPDDPDPLSASALLDAAAEAFDAADAALRRGDLAGYQAEVERVEDFLRRARDLLAVEPEDPPEVTSTPTTASA